MPPESTPKRCPPCRVGPRPSWPWPRSPSRGPSSRAPWPGRRCPRGRRGPPGVWQSDVPRHCHDPPSPLPPMCPSTPPDGVASPAPGRAQPRRGQLPRPPETEVPAELRAGGARLRRTPSLERRFPGDAVAESRSAHRATIYRRARVPHRRKDDKPETTTRIWPMSGQVSKLGMDRSGQLCSIPAQLLAKSQHTWFEIGPLVDPGPRSIEVV